MTKKILVLAGDGIGPEVTTAAEKVLRHVLEAHGLKASIGHALFGGACYDVTGEFITGETMRLAHSADAILLGAEGGPKWDALELDGPPESRSGLTRLRRELDLFANLRPIRPFDELLERSTLKADVIRGVDFIVLRELCGGIYFGEPRGITRAMDGQLCATDTQVYTESEITRIARAGFELAKSRRRRLCSVDKANVMESGVLWRRIVSRIGAEEFPEVAVSHLYVDNAAMQIVRNPRQFDVLVTDNLFGDILSDCAAMITGSLGMLPSASLAYVSGGQEQKGLYEPVHGSAPDIAGRGIANPLAAILSVGLLLQFTFGRPDLNDIIVQAVSAALRFGNHSADLGGAATTAEVTETVMAALRRTHPA
jgi:3-isopropylmalate dehydrogenase